MKTTKNYYIYQHHRLYYRTYGSGSESLLAFHGYGQDHQVFEVDGDTRWGHRYTLYAFDLFLHGKSSNLSEEDPLPASQWHEIVRHFLNTRHIDSFSLMGYSMGGRFVLTLVEYMAKRIRSIILIAPDGVRSNGWYRLASGTIVGAHLLRTTVLHPRPFFIVLKAVRRVGWVQKSVMKFVERHMNTRQKRWLVYRRWTGLRNINPRLRVVIQRINAQDISVEIYLGQYDRIVKAKPIEAFHKKLNNSILHHTPCGHNKLIDEVARHVIAKHL